MKKSLLALAVLATFAGSALAESSVTAYGSIMVSANKAIGSKDRVIGDDPRGSRLGFRGVEDLGDGLKAHFQIEHRFNPGDGQANSRFWAGKSVVGLSGDFGTFEMGRDYSVNYIMNQDTLDPFGSMSVGTLGSVGTRASRGDTSGSKTVNRYASQVEYKFSTNGHNYSGSKDGFNFGVQVAEHKIENGASKYASDVRPFSLAGNYTTGPVFLSAGWQRDADETKNWTIGGKYNFGFMNLMAGYARTTVRGALADTTYNSALIGAIIPAGPGNVKVGYAKTNNDVASKFAVGYDYFLSKRTRVYFDVANDSKIQKPSVTDKEKIGYDLGLRHDF